MKKFPSIVDLTVDVPSPPPPPPLQDGWNCEHCTFRNPINTFGKDCETCGLPPSSGPQSSSSITGNINSLAQKPFSSSDHDSSDPKGRQLLSTSTAISKDSPEFNQQKREMPNIVTRHAIQKMMYELRMNRKGEAPSFALSSACDHISQASEKWLWSCGYRNIQMMLSALMTEPTYKAALFGGSGIIPDIPSLQMWIERAWRLGFDPEGAVSLGGKLLGAGKKWIGSTEAAVLLRSFGLRAQLVSFHAFDDEQVAHLCSPEETTKVSSIRKDAEARLFARAGKRPLGSCFSCGKVGHFSSKCPNPRRSRLDEPPPSLSMSDGTNRPLAVRQEEQVYFYSRNQGLVDWVTEHFHTEAETVSSTAEDHGDENKGDGGSGEEDGVGVGGGRGHRPFPVFFQHSGHSRLLVGWEVDPVTGLKRSRDDDDDDDDEREEEETKGGNGDIRSFFPSLSRSSSTVGKSDDTNRDKARDKESVIKPSTASATSAAVGGGAADAASTSAEASLLSNSSSLLVTGKSRLSLLIFDPAIEKDEFDGSIVSSNWRRVVKRGLHTLRESQFEAVYVERGSLVEREGSEAWEKLKILDQIHYISGLKEAK